MIAYFLIRGCSKPIIIRTMQMLADEVGVSKPTIARWFDNQRYLYRCTDYDIYRIEVPKLERTKKPNQKFNISNLTTYGNKK